MRSRGFSPLPRAAALAASASMTGKGKAITGHILAWLEHASHETSGCSSGLTHVACCVQHACMLSRVNGCAAAAH